MAILAPRPCGLEDTHPHIDPATLRLITEKNIDLVHRLRTDFEANRLFMAMTTLSTIRRRP